MVAEAVFLVVRLVVGGVFLVALAGKLRDPAAFRAAVRGFRVVPRRAERVVVRAVLAAEVAVVALVAVRPGAAAGLGLAVVLLIAFAAGMARVVARGEQVPCGCFGRSTAPISRAHVARNALLAAAGAAGLVAGLVSGGEPLDGGVLLVLALFSAAVVAVLVLSDQLLEVAGSPRRPGANRSTPSQSPGRRPVHRQNEEEVTP